MWLRRKVFYHDRLGEDLTIYSELTTKTLKETAFFGPTGNEAKLLLNKALETQASALGLADCFYFIGWLMLALLAFLSIYLIRKKIKTRQKLLLENLSK